MLGIWTFLLFMAMLFVFPILFLRREISRFCPANGGKCIREYAEPLLPQTAASAAAGVVIAFTFLILAWYWRKGNRSRV